jgi:hypothetical protein
MLMCAGEFVSRTYGVGVWVDVLQRLDLMDEWHEEGLATCPKPEAVMQK